MFDAAYNCIFTKDSLVSPEKFCSSFNNYTDFSKVLCEKKEISEGFFLKKYINLNLVIVTDVTSYQTLNTLNAELNPIRHLLALVGARHIVHVSRIRDKSHLPFASTGRSSQYCPR